MEAHQHHDECYACPVGDFFQTTRSTSPETFEHLLKAAAELAAAARTIVEAAERLIESQRHGGHSGPTSRPGAEKIQRIRIADE